MRRDMVRGIELLEATGCKVKVVRWNPDEGKGLDDLIAQCGAETYTRAIARASSPEREKRIHYRTEYNQIARKVKKELGAVSAERLDLEVYLRAVEKGELGDGVKVIAQGDRLRSLEKKQPELVEPYLKAVASVAGVYGRLAKRDVKEKDSLATLLVERAIVAEELREKDASLERETELEKGVRPRLS